jgi:hypothetical protein
LYGSAAGVRGPRLRPRCATVSVTIEVSRRLWGTRAAEIARGISAMKESRENIVGCTVEWSRT